MTLVPVDVGAGPGAAPGRFIGREAELDVLTRAAAQAATGRRQLVVVSGEAGIGKTSLAERAAEQAERAGFRVVWGHCWPYGGAPALWPWPALLTELSGPRGARLLAEDAGRETVDPERFARFCAVADLLTERLDGQPTIVIIDDLHAADEGALLLTRFLFRALTRSPLLLLLVRRPADASTDASAPGGRDRLLADLERDATVVSLRRFDLYDTAAFLEAHGLQTVHGLDTAHGLDTDALDAHERLAGGVPAVAHERSRDLARMVQRVTGGNPLFLSRVVMHGSPTPSLAGVEQAVSDAVARLSPTSRRMLALLSILGRTASVFDLAGLAGDRAATVLDALAEAHRAGLVEPLSDDRYAFGHDLMREAAAATLTASQRLDAHARAAALIESSPRPDRLRRRAHHALAAALRSDVDAAIAVDACRDAAEAMRRGFDYQQAAALLDAAVAVAESHPATAVRAELLVERAEAVLARGHLTAARTAFGEAAAALGDGMDPRLSARAALGLGGVWLNEHRDPLERRRVLAMQRTALAGLPERETTLRCRLAVRLAAEDVYDGGPLAAAHDALARVRRVGDGRALAEALSLVHHAMLGPEHAGTRLALAEELLTVASAAGEGVLALFGLLWRTVDLFALGDHRAERSLTELRERADTLGCQSILYIVAAMEVMGLVRAGRLDEAQTAAGTCFELGVRVGDADAALFYAAQLGSIRWLQGRDAEMLDLVSAATATPTLPLGDFAFPAAVAAMTARVGRTDEARIALDRLTERGLAGLPGSSTWLAGMVAIAEAAGLVGDRPVAAEVYRLLTPFADLPVTPSLAITCFGSPERALGIVAAALGDHTGAVRHHERAVAANRKIGNRPATAVSRADLAEALSLRGGEDDLARARLLWEQARTEAVAMNLPVRAEQWAARLRAPAPRAAAVLAREPDGWVLTADGRRMVLPDLQGVQYLAVLLERPGDGVSALDLCGATVFDAGHHEVADRRAVDAYRRRLRDLEADLDDADADNDLERAHRLRRERDEIRDHLARAVGLGGRTRAFTTSPERARTAVRKAVKRALDTIGAVDPALGAELQTTITTGLTCRYVPDSTQPRPWTIRR